MKKVEYENYIEIFPYKGDDFHIVTVYKRIDDIFRKREAGVNWGCHGTETPENAELYAKAILEAAKIARELNKVKSQKGK